MELGRCENVSWSHSLCAIALPFAHVAWRSTAYYGCNCRYCAANLSWVKTRHPAFSALWRILLRTGCKTWLNLAKQCNLLKHQPDCSPQTYTYKIDVCRLKPAKVNSLHHGLLKLAYPSEVFWCCLSNPGRLFSRGDAILISTGCNRDKHNFQLFLNQTILIVLRDCWLQDKTHKHSWKPVKLLYH